MNRQCFPRVLYLVATPIGTLADASPRMKEVLEGASIIACEDTRVFLHLREALSLQLRENVQVLRCDAHGEARFLEKFNWENLELDAHACLVSDAGTPGVQDPGQMLIEKARSSGVDIRSVPGPSALAAAISLLGISDLQSIHFGGYFPRNATEQRALFGQLDQLLHGVSSHPFAGVSSAFFYFESPHRIDATLQSLATLPSDYRIFFAKEISKHFERSWQGTVLDLQEALRNQSLGDLRGEWVIAIVPRLPVENKINDSAELLEKNQKLIELLDRWNHMHAREQQEYSVKALADLLHRLDMGERKDLYSLIVQKKKTKS